MVGINTIDDMANTPLKVAPKLNSDIFRRLKLQAKLQISSEGKTKPDHRILPHDNERCIGLSLLAPHSDSDIFFDIEGFPYYEGGLEYLWGATYFDQEEVVNLKILGA